MAKESKTNQTGGLEKLPYEQLVEQLEGVVRQLEAGDLPLEDSLRAFEKGIQLSQMAEGRLDAAEHRVEVLLQGNRLEPLPAHESAEAMSVPEGKSPAEDDDVPF